MRRARRFRNTPCRQNRKNRLVSKQKLPPSTKARWQWKLRICKWLTLMFPVSTFVVEDIKAKTWKGARRWNVMFSPLEVGKKWFYSELEGLANLETRTGNDTYEIRQALGLKKSKNKLSNNFDAHCVDSWVLANWFVSGESSPRLLPLGEASAKAVSLIDGGLANPFAQRLRQEKGGSFLPPKCQSPIRDFFSAKLI